VDQGQTRREPQRGLGKYSCVTPLARKFLNFCRWHILVYFVFLSDSWTPKHCGAQGNSFSSLSTGVIRECLHNFWLFYTFFSYSLYGADLWAKSLDVGTIMSELLDCGCEGEISDAWNLQV